MVDNQHRKIKGYRDLSKEEIAMINSIKCTGVEIEYMIKHVQRAQWIDCEEDLRWIAIAKTHFQQGLMALTRAVAKPESF